MKIFTGLLWFLTLLLLAACGTGGSDSITETPDPTDPTDVTVSVILLSTNSSTIATESTASITVRLLDDSGQVVTETKNVSFTLDNPGLASIPSPATTSSGVLTNTLTAGNVEGTIILTASVDDVTEQVSIQISDQLTAASISVSSSPNAITVGGTSVVTATVLDSNNDPMSDGTTVNFYVDNTSLGTIVSSSDISGGAGAAQATFSAGTTSAGTATVTASSGVASGSTTLSVAGAEAGSIEFISATPQIVVIKGSGGVETSLVEFLVKDSAGNPVVGSQAVNLTLSGPNGGEYIGSTPGTTELVVGTVDGEVSTILHSGTIPGTVNITANVEGTALTSSSGVIAIGGGVPSEGHFSLATTVFNLEGLAYDGITADINARIADRYGNYNVLEGTSVSFYSECGAIDRAINLSADGEGTVVFRTQRPYPEDIILSAYDNAIADDYSDFLGVIIDDTNNPSDGLCTIIAVVDGEEEFTDANANGLYDLGESYDDTYDDIHLDKDDDSESIPFGGEVAGNPYDSNFEDLVVDRNLDGSFDGRNDIWDSNKRISRQIKLLITGEPRVSVANSSGVSISENDTITVTDGDNERVYFSLHDRNHNSPIAGTNFRVSCDVGEIGGKTDYTYIDHNNLGAPIFSVVIADSTAGDTDAAEIGTLEISWTWKGDDYSYSVLVEVD